MVPSFDLSSHDALTRSSAVATTLSVHPGTREPRVQSMPGYRHIFQAPGLSNSLASR